MPTRVRGTVEADEVARDQRRALMDELVVRVLAVRARRAPHDRTGVGADRVAVEVDGLAVRLHVELLQVRGEPRQVVVVRQHGMALRAEEVAVPDAEQSEQHRHVAFERRRAEVLVDRRGSRRASRGRRRDRWRSSATGRWPSRSCNGRRPSPRTRTCCRCRCRTRRPSRRWSTPRRSGSERRPSSPSWPTSHSRADFAFVIVSIVVNVFDATMNSVSAASRSCVASQTSLPSTFDTNRQVRPRSVKSRSASYAIAGPRSEPPMPMLTTLRMRLPGEARPLARAHTVRELGHLVEHVVDVGDDVLAVDHERARRGACATRRGARPGPR